MKICKTYRFEAAHHLPGHKGKCAMLHGHSYRLEVEVEGIVINHIGASDDGMVMDFDDLDAYVEKYVIDALDHTDLNAGFVPMTTAEAISEFIGRLLARYIDIPGGDYPGQFLRRLSRVRLYETEKAYAEWTP